MTRIVPNRRPARCLTFAVVLLAFAPGCQALYGYRPVSVLVRDVETKKPLPGAEVHISYPLADSAFAPSACGGTTGADGIVHLRAAPYGDAGIAVDVTAGGYMAEETTLPLATVQALEPAHLFEAVERRPVSLVVELYAEPHPAIEMVLTAGYRGVLKVEVHIQEDAPCPPGQRLFSGVMSSAGVVEVAGPPLLRRVVVNDIRARFVDGTPVSQQPKGAEVGLWWLNSESLGRHEFFVGTPAEYDNFRLFSSRGQSGEAIVRRRQEWGARAGRAPRRVVVF